MTNEAHNKLAESIIAERAEEVIGILNQGVEIIENGVYESTFPIEIASRRIGRMDLADRLNICIPPHDLVLNRVCSNQTVLERGIAALERGDKKYAQAIQKSQRSILFVPHAGFMDAHFVGPSWDIAKFRFKEAGVQYDKEIWERARMESLKVYRAVFKARFSGDDRDKKRLEKKYLDEMGALPFEFRHNNARSLSEHLYAIYLGLALGDNKKSMSLLDMLFNKNDPHIKKFLEDNGNRGYSCNEQTIYPKISLVRACDLLKDKRGEVYHDSIQGFIYDKILVVSQVPDSNEWSRSGLVGLPELFCSSVFYSDHFGLTDMSKALRDIISDTIIPTLNKKVAENGGKLFPCPHKGKYHILGRWLYERSDLCRLSLALLGTQEDKPNRYLTYTDSWNHLGHY